MSIDFTISEYERLKEKSYNKPILLLDKLYNLAVPYLDKVIILKPFRNKHNNLDTSFVFCSLDLSIFCY